MILIIGKSSNLSRLLFKSFDNTVLISSKNPIEDISKISFETGTKVTLIFNNFQKSTMLNNLENPVEYVQRSLMTTAEVLSFFINESMNINKVIYTSSSAVYGNNIFCSENDPLIPMNLQASLKITNEKLVESFCQKHNLDYTICRLFNMYGGYDEFSIISKIIDAAKNDRQLILFNNGNAIRDFIHVDDVVRIYLKLIDVYNIPIINIGTSNGTSIKNILDFLANNNIMIRYESLDRKELKVSTANIEVLKNVFGDISFHNVEKFILNEVLK